MLEASWKEKVIDNQKRVLDTCHCSSCGGDEISNDFQCIYCGNVNLELKGALTNLSSFFKEKELDDPFVVVSLKKMTNYLEFISSFSKEEVSDAYFSWVNKVLGDDITDLDYDAIINLFSGADLYQDEAAILIQDKILIDTVLQRRKYPYEVVTGAINHFFYQILKPSVKTCSINSQVLDENISGLAYSDKAVISDADIRDFINFGGSSVINTVGHEARHVYQNYKMVHGIAENKYDLLMLYDSVVNTRRVGTYDRNYYRQIAEIDARMMGHRVEEQFLKMFGIKLPDDFSDGYNVDLDLLLKDDTSRIIDDTVTDLGDEVLSILNEEEELYNQYSQFHYEFVKENNQIRWKSKMELVHEYLDCNDSKKSNFYFELVGRAVQREKSKDVKTI